MNLTHNTRLDWFSPGASKHPVFGQITEGFEIAMEISEVSTARQPRTRSSLHRAHIYCAVCSAQIVHTHATHLRGAYHGRQPEHSDYDEVDHDLRTMMRLVLRAH